MSFHRFTVIAVFSLVVLLTWTTTAASRNRYGAISYSRSTGRSGAAAGFSTQAAANQAAANSCYNKGGGRDCYQFIIHFNNTCAALAVGRNGASAYGYGQNRSTAEQQALSKCYGCGIVAWGCSK